MHFSFIHHSIFHHTKDFPFKVWFPHQTCVIHCLNPRTWSTLFQIMACCLMAWSHCQKQCWLIINIFWWLSLEGNSIKGSRLHYKTEHLKSQLHIPRDNDLSDITTGSTKNCCWIWDNFPHCIHKLIMIIKDGRVSAELSAVMIFVAIMTNPAPIWLPRYLPGSYQVQPSNIRGNSITINLMNCFIPCYT